MAKYKLIRPAFVAANGSPNAQYFEAGLVIDYDGIPSECMQPLDEAAIAAVAARDESRPFKVAKNGLQVIDRKSGQPFVAKFR